MKKNIFKLALMLSVSLLFASCSDNDDKIEMLDYGLKINLPADLKDVDPSGLQVKLLNINTNYEQVLSTNSVGVVSFMGLPGVFNITVSGTKTQNFINSNGEEATRQVELVGFRENVPLSSATQQQAVDVKIQIAGKGWVIKEIYFQGSKTLTGSPYLTDQFVEIYNNTDSVMYADGIALGEAAHNTNIARENLYKTEMPTITFVSKMYSIPGNGRDVPVKPGESILLAPAPINHKEANPNSIDLSIADYQWFDPNKNLTIDVPEVPNMDKHYSNSKSSWTLHSRGFLSLMIFKAPNETTAAEYATKYTDIRTNAAGTGNATTIGVRNNDILDAVELGNKTTFKFKAFDSSLDVSFTYCDALPKESTPGGSVRRKVESITPEGRVIYKDTNNSALDFIPNAVPQPKIFKAD